MQKEKSQLYLKIAVAFVLLLGMVKLSFADGKVNL